MTRYLIGRLIQLIPTVLGVTLVAFILIRLSGDPVALMLAPDATEAERHAFREAYGLNDPILVQYVRFLANLLRGDLGTSLWEHRPALSIVLDRFKATLQLGGAAVAIVLTLGIPLGVLAAVRRGSLLDLIVMGLVALGQSVATFWLGIMLILIFAAGLRWFPPSGYGTAEYLVLPAVTLAAYYLAFTTRLTRSSMLEVLGQDYLRTARAKGLSEFATVFGHGFRNALIPIVTVLGLQFAEIMGGAVVTEIVFGWPGVGTLTLDAVMRRDYPVVQATLLVISLVYAAGNLLVDLLYGVLDPRIRY